MLSPGHEQSLQREHQRGHPLSAVSLQDEEHVLVHQAGEGVADGALDKRPDLVNLPPTGAARTTAARSSVGDHGRPFVARVRGAAPPDLLV